MSEQTAEQLDLSRLPPLTLQKPDYEGGMAARKASLVAKYAARGIPFNTENLDTDPVIIQQQEDEQRRLLDIQALNDTARGLTVAYGHGDRLDHIAATYFADIGVRRLALVAQPRPLATHAEDWETDDRFRRRIVLANEARSPYTAGAYVYAALSASPDVADAVALNHESALGLRQPEIRVVILARDAEPPIDEDALVATVRAALMARAIRPATDVVSVTKARRHVVPYTGVQLIRRGPDPALVRAEGLRRLALYRVERRRIGRVMANSGLDAAIHVGGVEDVRSAFATVDPGPDGVVELSPITITTEAIGG